MKQLKLGYALATAALVAVGLTGCMTEHENENENNPRLQAQARLTRADAEKIALARVPGGNIKEGGLEKEHGKLLYSFDIATPGTRNITEVQVDALSGVIVAVDTETPDDQAKEKAEDARKTKKEKEKDDDEDEKK